MGLHQGIRVEVQFLLADVFEADIDFEAITVAGDIVGLGNFPRSVDPSEGDVVALALGSIAGFRREIIDPRCSLNSQLSIEKIDRLRIALVRRVFF